MPAIYQRRGLPIDGAELYNAIVTDTPTLNGILPAAVSGSTTNAREIGNLLYNRIDLSNPFINTLLNRVALVVMQSKVWSDPWMGLEKGKLLMGEVVEEVFIRMAKPHTYNPERAEQEVFKREFPDISTAFHAINYKKFYKQTIQREDLRQAFLSWNAFMDFVRGIIEQMYTAANYDAYQTKKYILAYAILNGALKVQNIPEPNTDNARSIVASARGVSNMLTIMSDKYNYFGVPNYTRPEDQVIIINAMYEGVIDVEVLAASFNMDKAEFLTMHRLITDGFGSLDTARLGELFANDTSYVEISSDELAELDKIPFVILDRNFFQIYDYVNIISSIENPEGLYWNYWHHVWKVFGISPFANAVVFNSAAPTVMSIILSPATATVSPGQRVMLEANVETVGFASKKVVWSVDSDNATISQGGILQIKSNAQSGERVTVTATSLEDSSKSGTAVVTVG